MYSAHVGYTHPFKMMNRRSKSGYLLASPEWTGMRQVRSDFVVEMFVLKMLVNIRLEKVYDLHACIKKSAIIGK
jgi:hypothetical protein